MHGKSCRHDPLPEFIGKLGGHIPSFAPLLSIWLANQPYHTVTTDTFTLVALFRSSKSIGHGLSAGAGGRWWRFLPATFFAMRKLLLQNPFHSNLFNLESHRYQLTLSASQHPLPLNCSGVQISKFVRWLQCSRRVCITRLFDPCKYNQKCVLKPFQANWW